MRRQSEKEKREILAAIATTKEVDFSRLNQLLDENKGNRIFYEYIKYFCCCRKFVLGLKTKNEESFLKLNKIIDLLGKFDKEKERIILPPIFEEAKEILLSLKRKEDFTKVLREIEE